MAELRPAHTDSRALGGSTPRRPRFLLTILVLLTTITSLVSSLGAPLVPQIALDYDVSLSTAQWTLTSTLLVGAVASPLVGRLGGNRRRRPVVLAGLGLVGVGLLLSALPTGFPGLIAGRALQGIGIALFPLAIAAAREGLPTTRVSSALALLSVASAAGAGIGYPLTSWVAGELGLSAAFWLAFGITAFTWCLTAAVLPSSSATAPDPVDWWGTTLLSLGILSALLALALGPRLGWLSPEIGALALTTTVTLAAWVRRSLRGRYPLVDLRLAGSRATLPANLTAFLAGIALYMLLTLVMVAVQLPPSTGFGLGEPASTAGLLLTPYAVATVAGSRLAVLLNRWVRLDHLLPLGALVYVGATLMLATAQESLSALFAVMAISGMGSGLMFAAVPGLIVRSTPMRETGSAMAFNLLLRFLGFSFGSTLAMTCLELFSRSPQPDEKAFTHTVLVAVGIWALTAAISLCLAPSRAQAQRTSTPMTPTTVDPI